MDQKKIARINELYRKSKTASLTPAEKKEQQQLRQEYLAAFKKNLTKTLDQVIIVEKDGTQHPLERKKEK